MPYISALISMIAKETSHRRQRSHQRHAVRLQALCAVALEQEEPSVWQYSTEMLYSLFFEQGEVKREKYFAIPCKPRLPV